MGFYNNKYLFVIVLTLFFGHKLTVAENVIEINSYKFLLPNFNTYSEEVKNIVISLEDGMHCQNLMTENIIKLNSIPPIDPYFVAYRALINIQYRTTIGEFEEANHYINKYIDDKDFPYPGRLFLMKGALMMALHSYSEAISDYHIAIKAFTINNDTLGLIHGHYKQLMLYVYSDNKEYAKNSFLTALTLCQKNNYENGLILIYNTYGKYSSKWDPAYASDILQKAWELVDDKDVGMKMRIALSYLKFLVTNKEFDIFNMVYNDIKKSFNPDCFNIYYSTIETLNAHKFSLLNNIDSSIFYNRLALRYRKNYGSGKLIGYSFLNLMNNYLQQNNYQTSKLNLDSAFKYLYIDGTAKSKTHYLNYSLKYYEAINKVDSIIVVYQELINLGDAYFYEHQKNYLSKIKAEYQVQNRLEKEKYETELKYNRSIFASLAVISFLLLIILMGVLILFIKKTKRFNVLKIKSMVSFATIDEYKREIKQLKNIFENAVTGFFILDKNLNIKYINKRAELIISAEGSSVKEKPFIQLIKEEYRNDFISKIPSVINDYENFELQVKLGNTVQDQHINFSFSPMIINNEIESILVIAIDISSRVKALELEKKQKTVLQTLFNSVTESIILMDGSGIIELVNETGAKRLGKTVQDLIGANYYNILPNTIKSERESKITQSLEQKKPIVYAENIETYNTLVSIYPSFDSDGKVNYIAEFTQDITDRKLAYQQINSLRQKVLRSQMNPHFIFNSLNAIQSFVLKNDSEQAVKYLNSFARLIRMILDSSRFDYINIEKEVSILEYYLQLQQLRFGEKFIWSLEVDKNIDIQSVLIPAMLAQPFIENAIEHGLQHLDGNGAVKISFKKVKDSIIFKVADNGIGREASKTLKRELEQEKESLSIKIFNERLFTLNKYSGKKITYEIIDLKDANGKPTGTEVIINLPVVYSSHLV